MADPKGIYFSPTGAETGLATVLPTPQRRSYANMFAKEMAARRKLKAADDAARRKKLAGLTGNDIGQFHTESYAKAAEELIAASPNMSDIELDKGIVQLNARAQASTHVEDDYDVGVKWSQRKDSRVNQQVWNENWASKYADTSMESVSELAANPRNYQWYLEEPGGSENIDVNKAMRFVVKDNFKGYIDQTEWEKSAWSKIPIGYESIQNTLQSKVHAFSKVEGDDIVMLEPPELVEKQIVQTFKDDPDMHRVLLDEARPITAARKGIAEEDVDETLDITDLDMGYALQKRLTPYVEGVLKEAGTTLTIRPVGGYAATKDVKYKKGLELWREQLTQGAPAAISWAEGAKIGSDEVVAFSSIPSRANVSATSTAMRRNLQAQDWYQKLDQSQRRAVLNDMDAQISDRSDARMLITWVTRTPIPSGQQTGAVPATHDYKIWVVDPEHEDMSRLGLIYSGGRKARGQDYDTYVGPEGQRQMGAQYEQVPPKIGWTGVNTTPTGEAPATGNAMPLALPTE